MPSELILPRLHIKKKFCNIFGGENDGGAKRVLGGIGPQTPSKQWFCNHEINTACLPASGKGLALAGGRYRMECAHGHKGQIMELCGHHLAEFRTAVSFCPRCNQEPKTSHKCSLKIVELS